MKKTIKAIIAGTTVFLASTLIPGCTVAVLSVPYGMTIDDSYRMTWNDVENARGYVLSIKGDDGVVFEDEARRPTYSLEDLEEGDYEIRIKADGGDSQYADSEWSEVVYFHREYENGCIYTLINNDTEYEVSGYGTSSGVVEVGGLYRGKPVTQIGDSAFRNSRNLESITLLDSVTHIGENAFFNCNALKAVVLSDNLTYIGSAAFQSCAYLESIVIPDKITELSANLFNYCRQLTDIELPETLEVIGDYAFANCSGLTSFEIPAGVTTIGKRAFFGADSLQTMTIGGKVSSVGDFAFGEMESLESVTIGSSVCEIGASAFAKDASLKEVRFDENCSLSGLSENMFSACTSLDSVVIPEGMQTIGTRAFAGCTSLRDISIAETVNSINANAFSLTGLYNDVDENGGRYVYADNWLVDITVTGSDKVVTVGDSTISEEYKNEDENFEPVDCYPGDEGNIIGIADSVFNNCPNLTYVVVPDSLRYIGAQAFSSCENLYTFQNTIYSNLEIIDTAAFMACENLSNLLLNDSRDPASGRSGLVSIGNYAFYGCKGVTNREGVSLIPDSVEHIGMMAFFKTGITPDEYGVFYAGDWAVGYEQALVTIGKESYALANTMYIVALESGNSLNETALEGSLSKVSYIVLKDTIRGIADYAFFGHVNLEQIDNLNDARYIGTAAFYDCWRLGTIALNINTAEIADFAFYGCELIDNVPLMSLPRLTRIGRSAFYGCSSLYTIEIPSSVTEIDDYAFYDVNIEEIKLGESIERIGAYAFYGNDNLKEINIPESVTEISRGAFSSCTGATKLNLGDSVETIGSYAFANCTSLTKITIPDSVVTINDHAFYNCNKVTELDLGSGLQTIGQYAFARMISLTRLYIPGTVRTIENFAFRACDGLRSVVISADVYEIGEHAFFNCNNATFFTDAASIPGHWSPIWNSSYRPVVWGTVLSDEGYVVSLTVGENTFAYTNEFNALEEPERAGYTFAGWATAPGASEAEYAANDIVNLPSGTVLYAVWRQN